MQLQGLSWLGGTGSVFSKDETTFLAHKMRALKKFQCRFNAGTRNNRHKLLNPRHGPFNEILCENFLLICAHFFQPAPPLPEDCRHSLLRLAGWSAIGAVENVDSSEHYNCIVSTNSSLPAGFTDFDSSSQLQCISQEKLHSPVSTRAQTRSATTSCSTAKRDMLNLCHKTNKINLFHKLSWYNNFHCPNCLPAAQNSTYFQLCNRKVCGSVPSVYICVLVSPHKSWREVGRSHWRKLLAHFPSRKRQISQAPRTLFATLSSLISYEKWSGCREKSVCLRPACVTFCFVWILVVGVVSLVTLWLMMGLLYHNLSLIPVLDSRRE